MLQVAAKFFSLRAGRSVLSWCRWLPVWLLAAGDFTAGAATNDPANSYDEVGRHLGQWIWTTESSDKQTCRLWKAFVIPEGVVVSRATLRITVDNGYRLFLDGREIGRGSDWRTMTMYDVTWLLSPGRHVLAVEGFNDRLEAGLIFGLEVEEAERKLMEVVSDDSWRIAPNTVAGWTEIKYAPTDWPAARIVGTVHQHPWEAWPVGVATEPPLLPLVKHFWQAGWFLLSLAIACALAVVVCVWLLTRIAAQTKAQMLLQVERVRIARDIHDDLGARLTELLLLGEVSRRELPEGSQTLSQFNQICDRARGLSHALDEVVWAVNSRRDTLLDFVNYVCKHAQFFLKATPIRCRLDVEAEIPPVAFDLPVRRNLFLAVKEALNNAAKHSGADELNLRIWRHEQKLSVAIEDNGRGFDPAALAGERNGMGNMAQRMAEIGGQCRVDSQPGQGCRIEFTVPLTVPSQARWLKWLRRRPPVELNETYPAVRESDPAKS